jgi:hypothetical protein
MHQCNATTWSLIPIPFARLESPAAAISTFSRLWTFHSKVNFNTSTAQAHETGGSTGHGGNVEIGRFGPFLPVPK